MPQNKIELFCLLALVSLTPKS